MPREGRGCGIGRGHGNGIKFGRKPKLTKRQREEALLRIRNGETLTEIAKRHNVSHMRLAVIERRALSAL